jgi:hypothetical protein
MTDTIFFRLLDGVNRPSRLSGAIEELREGGETSDVHQANPSSFRQVPGSPFAYWVSETMRHKFSELPKFAENGRIAQHGVSTKDDFRFLRTYWEVAADSLLDSGGGSYKDFVDVVEWSRKRLFESKRWALFAKGGEYSPYYADIHLVINWERDAAEIEASVLKKYPYLGGDANWVIHRECNYFYPGLTWPRRTDGLSFRVLPVQCIFADKGPAAFVWEHNDRELLALLAIVNSYPFYLFVQMLLARVSLAQSFEVGLIESVPMPTLTESYVETLGDLARRCANLKRGLDTSNDTSHAFVLPALLQADVAGIRERVIHWSGRLSGSDQQLAKHQREIDDLAFQLYGIESEDRRAIEELDVEDGATVTDEDEGAAKEDADEAIATLDASTLVADLLSYAVGCVFGRWDARIALDPSLPPKLADLFAPLPVCSPGMLVGPDGLPAKRGGIASEEWMRARPDAITPPPEGSVENPTISDSEYPLAVDWDGILVDDPEHEDDILRRVRDVLELVWGESAEEIEAEACEILGVKDLRAYFRNPRKFFDYHIKRYSKSRRKAPIYWLLQSPKRNFGLWIYYHRLDPDILFKALTKYMEPKIRLEEGRLEEFESRRRDAGTGGLEAKQAEKAAEDQEALLTDLREFRDRLQRAASLYLRPDLNDGVVLNIAPLHELVPWKEAKSKWDELLAGKYEWSSIGKQLRGKGLV